MSFEVIFIPFSWASRWVNMVILFFIFLKFRKSLGKICSSHISHVLVLKEKRISLLAFQVREWTWSRLEIRGKKLFLICFWEIYTGTHIFWRGSSSLGEKKNYISTITWNVNSIIYYYALYTIKKYVSLKKIIESLIINSLYDQIIRTMVVNVQNVIFLCLISS